MYGAIKAGITVVSAMLVLGILSPLIVFTLELFSNPADFLNISASSALVDERTGLVNITLKIRYSGSVVLKEFKLSVLNKTIELGDLRRGEYVASITVDPGVVTGLSRVGVSASFKIAGIYGFKVTVTGALS